MKLGLTRFTRGLGVVALTAISTSAILNQPADAGGTTFLCGTTKYQNRNVPATFARAQDGKRVLMIRWVERDYYGEQWSSQRRCREVSRRFQRSYDHGTLKYITEGIINGKPVICAPVSAVDSCTEKTILFTLKQGANAKEVLQQLLDRRGLAAGRVLNETNRSYIIDVDFYLNNAQSE